MHNRIRLTVLFAIVLGGNLLGSVAARAQGSPFLQVGANYNFVRTNAPPGGCGCFSMNGGNGWLSVRVTHHLAAVADIAAQVNGNVLDSGATLTLTSYLFGPRYTLLVRSRVHPFGQALVGGVNASGSFSHSVAAGSANELALAAGGGLDIDLVSHLGIRAAEVDYYFTDFANGSNNHQNNLRVSAGVYFRFGVAH